MAELSLAALVERGLAQRVLGDASVRIAGIRHDSRRVEPGDMYVAFANDREQHTAAFAPDAIARGAVAVLSDQVLDLPVPVLLCADALVALSAIARELYDDPTAGLPTVGITGTNGKTTTTYLVEAAVQAAHGRPAVFGTVEFRGPGGVRAATHTTPMADDMMRLARWAKDTAATHLVLEVSSHALTMHRADGVHFKVAAFTNITHDHLDYHGTFDAYAQAKQRLFTELAPEVSVLNVDDAFGAALVAVAHGRVLRCSRRAGADAELRVLTHHADAFGIVARVATPLGEVELRSPLVGEHNLENLLIALGCGLGLGLPLPAILAGLAQSRGAPGRLERVDHAQIAVFVDYAHTPDALERVLRALRPITRGRLWVVFGCGGDRDRKKRPVMGKAAVELADVAIVTSDNPRSEAPEQILSEIEAGILETGAQKRTPDELAGAARGYLVCADRRRAIALALDAASAGDSVLIAGKGHEKVQIIGSRREPFDDCAEARAALAARGPEA
jgi:UDP-N-acetylmuramoyl-L-alanyl-D-glutamate--2,6-diaminopimelate ligase